MHRDSQTRHRRTLALSLILRCAAAAACTAGSVRKLTPVDRKRPARSIDLASVSIVTNLGFFAHLFRLPCLASLPFAIDWHRATDGFQWRGHPIRFTLRSLGARSWRAAYWSVQAVPTGRGTRSPSIIHNRPSVYRQTAEQDTRHDVRGLVVTVLAARFGWRAYSPRERSELSLNRNPRSRNYFRPIFFPSGISSRPDLGGILRVTSGL